MSTDRVTSLLSLNRAALDAVISVLAECEEYFDQRADADCDQDGFIPNEEMKLLSEVRKLSRSAGAALDAVSATGEA